jgi:hypothetical protein
VRKTYRRNSIHLQSAKSLKIKAAAVASAQVVDEHQIIIEREHEVINLHEVEIIPMDEEQTVQFVSPIAEDEEGRANVFEQYALPSEPPVEVLENLLTQDIQEVPKASNSMVEIP